MLPCYCHFVDNMTSNETSQVHFCELQKKCIDVVKRLDATALIGLILLTDTSEMNVWHMPLDVQHTIRSRMHKRSDICCH